jgi:pimeloyl-ACP methyl ester carboxylesterase
MSDFVLVHGAWHGGWCWRFVADLLGARGHRVFTPTLTGLGERAHLLTPQTGLGTHVRDITAVLDAEELKDVVLVAHSYGGLPAVLATAHAAVARLVLVDAVEHVPGRALISGAAPAVVAAVEASLVEGPAMPPMAPAVFNVPDGPLADWLGRRLTPMPWKPMTEPLPPLPDRYAAIPKAYVAAAGNTLDGPIAGLAQARAAGWPVTVIASGHDLMVTAPESLADALEAHARD